MNRILLKYSLLSLVAVVSAAACSDDDGFGGDARCRGRLDIGGTASAAVVTRAETNLPDVCPGLKVPAKEELRLILTGSDIAELESGDTGPVEVGRFDYAKEWETLAQYGKEMPDLFPGEYRAVLEYGTPDAVGPDAPYYRGENKAAVRIGKETVCRVDVKVRNSVVRVVATDEFKNYFYEPEFRLYLDGSDEPLADETGEPFVFTLSDTDRPIFVPAGTTVTVKGSVRRPSQTSDGAGELLSIDELPARATVAGTLHTFRFTAQAGSAGLEVVFMEPEAGGSDDVEINDDAVSDKTGGESVE
ncbi:MAG: DUF4493 domain-containing protein [Alistipes senegalensis]|nr:DUF4493 domain-containing protein [Bacteroides cellulosilyticus]MCM1351150.1 DUF4493 domain-containing protein [Alistipes senegalensis]